MPKPSDCAWIGLGVAVLAYEALAAARRDFELLSEATDRYRGRHPIITDLTIVYLAAHLLRRWPARMDPLHLMASGIHRGRR